MLSATARRPRAVFSTPLLILGIAAFAVAGNSTAQAQGTETVTRSGTLVEVSKKGRASVIKYTDDAGAEQELLITPKIQVQVEAAGDADFIRAGQFVAAQATESNDQLFTKEVSIYLFGKTRAPAGKIQKAPPRAGQSQNAYQVTGTIVSVATDPDYPQYLRVEIKAAGPRAPLMLEEGFQVKVLSTDIELAVPGTPLELEGTELKNGRFNAAKVTVQLAEALKGADVLGSPEGSTPKAEGAAPKE